MDIYKELGVKTLINCAGTYTIIGGSKMSENTLEAMNQAARYHVVIKDLQQKIYVELAKMTHNEAARVTAGAMAGVYITIATCISKKFNKPLRYISKEDISKCEVIIHRAHRNPYDRGLETLGVKLVELGYPNNINPVTEEEFGYAFSEHTVAVLYLPSCNGGWVPPGALDLGSVIKISQKHDVPVVVDAAAQLPPKSNFWNFTEAGASAVCFSGGKDIRGPQTTGLVLGKKSLLDYFDANNFPVYGIGRMYKVGREELAGIYCAVKEYMEKDEDAFRERCEKVVRTYIASFSKKMAFSFERSWPNEAGQSIARLKMIINKEGVTPEMIKNDLSSCERSIFTMVENGSLYINPQMMSDEETDYVKDQLLLIVKKY